MYIETASILVLLVSTMIAIILLTLAGHRHVFTALRKMRRRWIMGLPLGTMVLLLVNIGFYLVVQRALWYPDDPLVLPFISWSFYYPLGVLSSSIGHAGYSHIYSNLTATIVFAPVAEYIIGHKNSRRPWIRALVLFPVLWLFVGICTSLFSWGPIIGFSGVVFGFIGLIVVFYPVKAVALMVFMDVFRTVLLGFRSPVSRYALDGGSGGPWWVGVSISGHAVGFVIGFLIGVYLVRRRRWEVNAFYLGGSLVAIGVMRGMYAVWFGGGEEYVLYRGVGVGLVLVLSGLLAVLVWSESSSFGSIGSVSSRRLVIWGFVVVSVLALFSVGALLNVFTVVGDAPSDGVGVGDYVVGYDEDIEREVGEFIPYLDLGIANYTTSGVYVISEKRTIWSTVSSKRELERRGSSEFLVGGVTWVERVRANRTGIDVWGNSTYSVSLVIRNESYFVYDSGEAMGGNRISGWRIGFEVVRGEEFVLLRRDNESRRQALGDGDVTVEGIDFSVNDGYIYASTGETEIRVAERN